VSWSARGMMIDKDTQDQDERRDADLPGLGLGGGRRSDRDAPRQWIVQHFFCNFAVTPRTSG
jgi:hypothetical protein